MSVGHFLNCQTVAWLEGSGRGFICGTNTACSWKDWGPTNYFSHGRPVRYTDKDFKLAPTENGAGVLQAW